MFKSLVVLNTENVADIHEVQHATNSTGGKQNDNRDEGAEETTCKDNKNRHTSSTFI